MLDFEVKLKENKLKTTHQRLAILTEIERAGHIDIDTLYKVIKSNFPTMALGTLYRNIADLKNRDILAEVKIPGQKNVYEIKKENHIHFCCSECGVVYDYPAVDTAVVKDIENRDGYSIDSVHLTLSGVCHKCKP